MITPFDERSPLPILDLYDSNLMLKAIQVAKEDYDQARQDYKDFKKEYRDFMSPFSKDMDRYNDMIGGIKDKINQLYANGIDPLRSAEGRMELRKLTDSVDPTMYNAMRANAKTGYVYLDAMNKLMQSGKYSEAQELFDIARNNGVNFKDFQTVDPNTGVINTWDRTSPIAATTLRDLTYKSYEHRTPRDLTAEDFKNDPRLLNYKMDPRYKYTGYLDSDLMKVAPGASASLVGDPRAEFFRDQAMQKVISRGDTPTEEAVEAQFQRDIADANAWALVDPIKSIDEYAKMDYEHRQRVALEGLRHKNALGEEGLRHKNALELARIKNAGNGRYSATTNIAVDSEGSLRGLLSNYIPQNSDTKLRNEETFITNKLKDISKNPSKYTKEDVKYWASQYDDLGKKREIAGIEGVADVVNGIKSGGTYFTDTPEEINKILRDLSSIGNMTVLRDILKDFQGTEGSDGGIYASKDRMCGVGTVMKDVLARGLSDGGNHKSIESAIKRFSENGDLEQYNVSWTAGAWDIRNETDDTNIFNSGEKEVWPTGRVLSGNRNYYIEVSNDPEDRDECCWIKIERDPNGGFSRTVSSITEAIDDRYMHSFSNSNVIGNQQSAVQGYNK